MNKNWPDRSQANDFAKTATVDRNPGKFLVSIASLSGSNSSKLHKATGGKPVTASRSSKQKAIPVQNPDMIKLQPGELDMLAKVIHAEARGEAFEGQVAVAAVVLNRVQSSTFPSSVREVIFQPGAFTAIKDGQYQLKPNESAYRAARKALQGDDPTGGAIYYYNPDIATSKWIRTRALTVTIGNHRFAR